MSESPIGLPRHPGGPRNRKEDRGKGPANAVLHTAAIVLMALAAVSFARPAPLLLWNASPSSPLGLYAVVPAGRPQVGDTVIAWPPGKVRRLAARRGYLPEHVPLVKRVEATAGSRVCATGTSLSIDSEVVVSRRPRDSKGRALPLWSGCKVLVGGELLLLSEHVPGAFDGRYFGITEPGEVIGKGRLLWGG